MPELLTARVGDRVCVRDRIWRVVTREDIPDQPTAVLGLDSVDDGPRTQLSVLAPPDEGIVLPNEIIPYDLGGLESFRPWSDAHQLVACTSVKETSLLAGAKWGRVQLEPYQTLPVLKILSKPRPSLLIAEDVGLGKTVEAGLIILELIARQRAPRVLIVTPSGLMLQWRKEMLTKFGLDFIIIENIEGFSRAQASLTAGVNPWDVQPRVITSVDFLKKETIRNRALRKKWDLIIVDEAHSLAQAGTPQNSYRTQRTKLGEKLRDSSRGLVLLTATPHNGYEHSFRSLLELVEPTRAVFMGEVGKVSARVKSAMVRRLKHQIKRREPNGSLVDVFPKRSVKGIQVVVKAEERELLTTISTYCSKTAKLAMDTDEEEIVTFAMQIVKKRALSSREALRLTIESRLDSLKKSRDEAEAPPTRSEVKDLQADLSLDDREARRTQEKVIRTVIPKDEKRRKAEVVKLKEIVKILNGLDGPDPKAVALLKEVKSLLDENAEERVIVFTEYLDTLDVLKKAFDADKKMKGRYVVLKGGMSPRMREKVQEDFEKPGVNVMLATDAASEGLNLQKKCRRIIHFELPWNPNRLEQRNGRVDRYGQSNPPVIKYLYYPDSPEDDILHRLVVKIQQIERDQVSTPDILGVISGMDVMNRDLVVGDQEELGKQKDHIISAVEERAIEYRATMKPYLMASETPDATAGDVEYLSVRAEKDHPEELNLEELVRSVIGREKMVETKQKGIFKIEVPYLYRGSGVKAVYPMATFRRSIAVATKPEEVDFITPVHPLLKSLSQMARRELLQVYAGEKGLPVRRLAARRCPKGEPVSAVFTFMGQVSGAIGLLEEHEFAVRVTTELKEYGTSLEAGEYVATTTPGEVTSAQLDMLFKASYEKMRDTAMAVARAHLQKHTDLLSEKRVKEAEQLLEDLKTDVADRLKEIEQEAKLEAGVFSSTRQGELFIDKAISSKETRKAAVKTFEENRKHEIEEYKRLMPLADPSPMGVLFLVPEGLV